MSNQKQTNRRDFLKGTTATAAGLALAGGLNIARTAHAAGDDQLKVVLVGCGGRGTGAAKDCLASSPNVKLVAVADVFADNAQDCLKNLRKQEDIVQKIAVPEDRALAITGLDPPPLPASLLQAAATLLRLLPPAGTTMKGDTP